MKYMIAIKLQFELLISNIKENFQQFLFLAIFFKHYRWKLFIAMISGSASAGCNALLILLARNITNIAFHGQFSQADIIKGSTNGVGSSISQFIWIILPIPLVMIIRGLLIYTNTYLLNWVMNTASRDMRRYIFSHMINQSMDFFSRIPSGELMSRILNDTAIVQSSFYSIIGESIKQPLTIIAVGLVLLHIDWKFTLSATILAPLVFIPVISYGRRVRYSSKTAQDRIGEMSVVLQETIAGIQTIKAFAREPFQNEIFEKVNQEQCHFSIQVTKDSIIVQPMIEVVSALGIAIALFYVYCSSLSIGNFVALLGGMFLLYDPIKNLSRLHLLFQNSFGATSSLIELLKIKPSIQNITGCETLNITEGKIVFKNVDFSYSSSHSQALKNINLIIHPGQQVALVGTSGAGKSTLLSLLLRFYDPKSGSIFIDNKDIKTVSLSSLREQIAIVPQSGFLFHDTIAENIRFGYLNAEMAEIEEAAMLAHAHEFILQQPNGYQTIIGEKGCLLSGGQQQRIAIARALLKKSRLLLLDEATSSLDSESERMIQEALLSLRQGRTVIAIAHRLSTILDSDIILVFQDGVIVDRGTHNFLLANSEVYATLFHLQFKN